jgi:hypothetical protein
MGLESPVLDRDDSPVAGSTLERRAYTRRAEDHTQLLRGVVSMLLAICGGLAVVFLFFAAMGAVDPGDAIAATGVALLMAVVWFAGFYYRHRTHAGRAQWRDRERRGF